MATVSTVPQLVDKKGSSYAVIAPKLKPRKFNKWKKRMLCYLAGMEPYYIQCIKDGPFKPKIAKGNIKPEAQWTQDERRVVVQDQRPCLPDDIIESVISCETTKDTWTYLVHSCERPSDTKENRIVDLKLEYQTFRAKPFESLSKTYTHYKTLLNELANDGGLRKANHTQTLDLADIYGRFVYEDNLIQRRYSDTKKALITTPSNTAIFTAFFSNNVVQDFQENSDDEVNERSSEEYLKDLNIETNLLKALTEVTETLKVIQDAVKDDLALNKKVIEATEAYTKNSTALTELLTLVKNFDFQGLKSLVEFLHATALKQNEHLASWAKSSTSMASNLGPRMTAVESSQAEIRSEISYLKQDTSEIKFTMTEIFQAFKGQSSAPSSSVPHATLAITEGPTNVEGRIQAEEEPTRAVLISVVKPITRPNPEVAMIESSSRPPLTDLTLEIHVPQRERKGIATDEQLESTKKLVPASKVILEDPDEPIRVSYMINGKMHYLTNDEINAHLKKEDKIKKAAEEAKMFEMTKTEVIKVVQEEAKKIRLDPKTIISAKAGEKFKKAQDAEHQKIHEELGIQSALPAPVPEQAPSESSGRKRKHMELEPEIKVSGLECNRSLPEGVLFINNMVIEEPEYGIFFTDVFGDQAFQIWNDIHKVGVDSLVSYLVMASMVKILENSMFGLKLKKLIAEHPDQEKLQSKKVKLEALGYKLE
ncbi:hypothetical protein Tco_0627979 [Tanacetum coccineum]|uniref:Uncharacterized protein n=1 Tax=Tanacetum coccineum TaxID=301880 RepID=A0ABQ4WNZ0_9ASTR